MSPLPSSKQSINCSVFFPSSYGSLFHLHVYCIFFNSFCSS
jgi:hypothetical protein